MHQGIDRHRLRPVTLGDIIEVRNIPARRPLARRLARSDPHGMSAKLQLIPSVGRSLECAETRLHRLIGTMHDAHAFFVAELRIRFSNRDFGVAAADVRLAREAERREGGTLRRHVEFRELHLAGVATLLTRVVSLR